MNPARPSTDSSVIAATSSPVSITCISLSFVRARAVAHASPVLLAPVLLAVRVSACARLVRVALGPGRSGRLALGGCLPGAVAAPPLRGGLLAPGRLPVPGGL